MTIVIFTDDSGTTWKVWQVTGRLVFHAKTGARRSLELDGRELPDLLSLREEPRTLEALCREAVAEAA